MSSEETSVRLPDEGNADIRQRDSGHLVVPTTARARLIKPGIPNRSQGQGRSCEQTIRRRGVCVPALKPRGGWEGSQTKCQGFKPYLGNPAVRHYRGASGNVVTVEL